MLFIREQLESLNCHYQAHVWFTRRSHQCGCFATRKTAKHWADWLQQEIVTRDLFKVLYTRPGS